MRRILYLWVPHLHTCVEQGWDATLKGQPVIVAAGRFQRGTVIDASPEAEAMGAGAGMTWRHAHRRCPVARFIRYERPRYTPVVEQIGAVLTRFTPWVELMPGREDEFFADLSTTDPDESARLARRIQSDLAGELGLETRAALASGKFPARTLGRLLVSGSEGNDFTAENAENAKTVREEEKNQEAPSGRPLLIPPFASSSASSAFSAVKSSVVVSEAAALRPLPIDTLWELKPEVRQRLLLLGIRTLGQLAAVPQRLLVEQFGPVGRWYRLLARGIDNRRVAAWQPSPTVAERSSIDVEEPELPFLEAILDDLACRVSERLLRAGLYARTVTLIAHLEGGDRRFATHHLKAPAHLRRHLFQTAVMLLSRITESEFNKDAQDRQDDWRSPRYQSSCLSCASLLNSDSVIRSPKSWAALELRAGGLGTRGVLQLCIFGEADRGPALRAAVARIQDRFGEHAILHAAQLFTTETRRHDKRALQIENCKMQIAN